MTSGPSDEANAPAVAVFQNRGGSGAGQVVAAHTQAGQLSSTNDDREEGQVVLEA